MLAFPTAKIIASADSEQKTLRNLISTTTPPFLAFHFFGTKKSLP